MGPGELHVGDRRGYVHYLIIILPCGDHGELASCRVTV